jgi:hypothetical protein
MKIKYSVFVFIIILTVFPSDLLTKGRQGAKLQIQKTDNTYLTGELIAVKKESLLLVDSDTAADISVALDDIEVIEILKKPKVLFGAGIGLIFGAAVGTASGFILGDDEPRSGDEQGDFKTRSASEKALINSIMFGLIGLIGGGIVGADLGKTETIYFSDLTPEEKTETLQKLSSKARIPDLK